MHSSLFHSLLKIFIIFQFEQFLVPLIALFDFFKVPVILVFNIFYTYIFISLPCVQYVLSLVVAIVKLVLLQSLSLGEVLGLFLEFLLFVEQILSQLILLLLLDFQSVFLLLQEIVQLFLLSQDLILEFSGSCVALELRPVAEL